MADASSGRMGTGRRVSTDDAGAVTVEAAFAVASIVAVVVLCAAGIATLVLNIRCIDAAREVARVSARAGMTDAGGWEAVVPDGATVTVRIDEEWVIARVEAPAPLPTIRVVAESIVLLEDPLGVER